MAAYDAAKLFRWLHTVTHQCLYRQHISNKLQNGRMLGNIDLFGCDDLVVIACKVQYSLAPHELGAWVHPDFQDEPFNLERSGCIISHKQIQINDRIKTNSN